jgi:hypothetical protein
MREFIKFDEVIAVDKEAFGAAKNAVEEAIKLMFSGKTFSGVEATLLTGKKNSSTMFEPLKVAAERTVNMFVPEGLMHHVCKTDHGEYKHEYLIRIVGLMDSEFCFSCSCENLPSN